MRRGGDRRGDPDHGGQHDHRPTEQVEREEGMNANETTAAVKAEMATTPYTDGDPAALARANRLLAAAACEMPAPVEHEQAGVFRFERPEPVEVAPVPAPHNGPLLAARFLPYQGAIAAAQQKPMGTLLVGALTGLEVSDAIDVRHYTGTTDPRLSAERQRRVEAAGGAETLAKFWRVIDQHGLRPLAETVNAADAPDLVSMIAGWEFMPS
jgi:hypothetical protein